MARKGKKKDKSKNSEKIKNNKADDEIDLDALPKGDIILPPCEYSSSGECLPPCGTITIKHTGEVIEADQSSPIIQSSNESPLSSETTLSGDSTPSGALTPSSKSTTSGKSTPSGKSTSSHKPKPSKKSKSNKSTLSDTSTPSNQSITSKESQLSLESVRSLLPIEREYLEQMCNKEKEINLFKFTKKKPHPGKQLDRRQLKKLFVKAWGKEQKKKKISEEKAKKKHNKDRGLQDTETEKKGKKKRKKKRKKIPNDGLTKQERKEKYLQCKREVTLREKEREQKEKIRHLMQQRKINNPLTNKDYKLIQKYEREELKRDLQDLLETCKKAQKLLPPPPCKPYRQL